MVSMLPARCLCRPTALAFKGSGAYSCFWRARCARTSINTRISVPRERPPSCPQRISPPQPDPRKHWARGSVSKSLRTPLPGPRALPRPGT